MIAAVACGGLALRGYFQEENAGSSYEKISESVVQDIPAPTENAESVTPTPEEAGEESVAASVTETPEPLVNPIDFATLQQGAPDAYAWIRIPDTKIDYPVVQSAVDDSFYLNHNAQKGAEFAGAIFSEMANSKDFSDPMTVLYGHNMKNGSMFQNLHKFEDRSFFDSHHDIFVYTPNKVLKYYIFAAYTFDNSHLLNTIDFSDPVVFDRYTRDILQLKSVYTNIDSTVEIKADDKLLTLSTCTGNSDTRYLVQAVLRS